MKFMRNIISGQCKNTLVRIQIGYTAIFIGRGLLPKGWSGLQLGLFAPAHNPKIGYKRIAFYGCFLPGMPGAVCRWPNWYRYMKKQISFRRNLCITRGWI